MQVPVMDLPVPPRRQFNTTAPSLRVVVKHKKRRSWYLVALSCRTPYLPKSLSASTENTVWGGFLVQCLRKYCGLGPHADQTAEMVRIESAFCLQVMLSMLGQCNLTLKNFRGGPVKKNTLYLRFMLSF